VAAVVLSHWFLDFLVHRPDLPLTPWSATRVGLGLWNSIPATLAIEAALFAAALAFYLRRTRALDRIGRWGLVAVVVFLLAAYVGAAFGPPPPSVEAIAWAGLIGGAVTALLGFWVDRHRTMAA
jgi:membrane associated rhomboid family serine protease